MRVEKTDVFMKWYHKLKDQRVKDLISWREIRIKKTGNLGDVRALGDGVSEIRIDYGPGYRIYYATRGSDVILLLIGADKTRQGADIERAKKMLRQLKKEWENG